MKGASLHVKLAIAVTLGALLVAVAASVLAYRRSYEASLVDSERSVQQLLETVRVSAGIAAYVGNAELARQVVDGLVKNDIVLGARIDNPQGLSVMAGERFSPPLKEAITRNLYAPFTPEELAGAITVLTNRLLIEQRARDAAQATSLSLVAQTFVVAFLVWILVFTMLTRPLARLSSGLHRIVPGTRERLASSARGGRDEIGVLVRDINRLLETVDVMLEQERSLRTRVEALEQRFRGIFEDSSVGIFLLCNQRRLVTANPAFFRLTACPEPASLPPDDDVLARLFAQPEPLRALLEAVVASGESQAADLRLLAGERWLHGVFSTTCPDDDAVLIEGVVYDITERRHAELRTRQLAEHDQLTGLLNRHSSERRLEELLTAARAGGDGFAVLCLDLDRFKFINDSYGHDAGDQVLIVVAACLRGLVRTSDVVARMGGDEFEVILTHVASPEVLEGIALKFIDAIGRPIDIRPGVQEQVGVSIGVAFYPEDGTTVASLKQAADEAMYAVKRAGRNGYALYAQEGQHRVHLLGDAGQGGDESFLP